MPFPWDPDTGIYQTSNNHMLSLADLLQLFKKSHRLRMKVQELGTEIILIYNEGGVLCCSDMKL